MSTTVQPWRTPRIPAALAQGSPPGGLPTAATVAHGAQGVSALQPSLTLLLATLTIPVGTAPVGVAAAPNGNLYVINFGSANVSVINSTTNTVITTVPTGNSPSSVAVAPNGNVYVANQSSANVTVINSTTNTVITTVPTGTNPFAVAVAPNGNVYVTNVASANVTVINSTTNTVITTVPTGTGPDAVAVAPNGNVYVTNQGSNSVTVINSATNAVITTVPVGNSPQSVAAAPNGNAYVGNTNSNSVTVINSTTNTVTTTLPTGANPFKVAVAPNGNVYVGNAGSANVTVINSATNTVITTVPTGSFPGAVAVAPTGNVFVANAGSNTVSVINSATNTVTDTVPVGTDPEALTVAPSGNVYVANTGSNTVSVILLAPTVTSISPAQGPATGGTVVTITGTNLSGATVTFNGNAATNLFYNAAGTQIIATTPAGVPGPATVVVTTSVGTATLPGAFTYAAAPTTSGITPAQGPVAGGTFVTITGTDLIGATVTLCGRPASNVIVNPAGTQITAITPPGTPGTCPVVVTTPSGASTVPGGFTYLAVPVLTCIAPGQGPAAGGTVVTITGTGLTGATVTFNGVPATAVSVNPAGTQITATTPPGSPGTAAVTVTTPGGTATLACCFTYQAVVTPHATSLTATPALIQLFPLQLHFPFLTATLTDTVTGLPVPGQVITFSTGGHFLGTAITDANGTASLVEILSLPLIIINGGYDATFAGTPTLQPSTAHAPFLAL
ncbi:IPT/TIG domain-containing protein [Streptomyces hygroscopicus]|uniref:IPT/TIG domain-containing protein n=1 Tax=Streptomyces hygroscopicus TaxID=1912 RepID=UPI001FCA9E8C|nr:IPT/TIG domain-containing protein [Streptomyces hygroscopicus]BDH09222.1 hypothetical protein HOK021_04010 [Streptomyces hygroscopicus]